MSSPNFLPHVVIFTAFILNYDFLDKKLIFLRSLESQKSRIRSQIRKSVVRIRYISSAYYYYKAGWPVSFWRRSWTSFSPPRHAPARSCSRPPRHLAPATAAAWAKPNTGFWPLLIQSTKSKSNEFGPDTELRFVWWLALRHTVHEHYKHTSRKILRSVVTGRRSLSLPPVSENY